MDHRLRELADQGFTLLPGVFSVAQVEAVLADLARAFAARSESTAVRSEAGSVYAVRNVLAVWPGAAQVWRQPPLTDVLAAALGPSYGLVRALYFDKPPDRTWALPWHKDLTIAVRDNRLRGPSYRAPTRKEGVPHVEAPVQVLEAMVTARLHLDDAIEENGPLKVIPGSHRTGKVLKLGTTPQSILAQRGDVLLMRPLLAHASGPSHPGTRRHRRILHLEFAASAELPHRYAWYTFVSGQQS